MKKQQFKDKQNFKIDLAKFLVGICLLFLILISIHQEIQIIRFKELLIKQQTTNILLKYRMDDLENENSDLEDRINDLESRVDDLENNQ